LVPNQLAQQFVHLQIGSKAKVGQPHRDGCASRFGEDKKESGANAPKVP
jgi:hypothetical protein